MSGFYTNLKKGFDALGVESELVSLTPHKFGYGDQQQSIFPAFARYCVVNRLRGQARSLPLQAFWLGMVTASRALLLVWAIVRFDAFMFCCATSFFRYRELPLLRLLGKRIIYNFHGSDGRPGFMDGFAENTPMPTPLRATSGYIGYIDEGETAEERDERIRAYVQVTALRKQNVAKIDRYAHVIINSPSHGQYHTRPFVQRLIIGVPYQLGPETLSIAEKPRTSDEVVILHSPSYPEGKGTPLIRAAISALQSKGHRIRFVEISGKPNREVLNELAKCDFVIDQAYSDMPMVGFATEAAFFAKPAVVGGYYATEIRKDIAAKWIPPSLFCPPEEIQTAIERLLVEQEFREALGRRAREFVEQNWSALEVAKRILALIHGTFPQDWLFDPSACSYVYGMGLSKVRLRRILAAMLERYGPQAFELDDKPALLQKVIAFAMEPVTEA